MPFGTRNGQKLQQVDTHSWPKTSYDKALIMSGLKYWEVDMSSSLRSESINLDESYSLAIQLIQMLPSNKVRIFYA